MRMCAALIQMPFIFSPPSLVLLLAMGFGAMATAWMSRRRRRARIDRTNAIHALAHDIAEADSIENLLPKAVERTQTIFNVSRVRIWRVQRSAGVLQGALIRGGLVEPSIPIHPAHPSPLPVLTLLNRSTVQVRNGQPAAVVSTDAKAALAAPLLSQLDAIGVIELLDDTRVRVFQPEEQLGLELIASQLAAAFERQQQARLAEQVARGERLAIAGQLVSAVVGQAVHALRRIQKATDFEPEAEPHELRLRLGGAHEAAEDGAESLQRLRALLRPEPVPLTSVDLLDLLYEISSAARRYGLLVQAEAPHKPAPVLTDRAQVKEVALSLLRVDQVEEDHSIKIAVSRIGDQTILLLERTGDLPAMPRAVLDLCRGLVQGLGGELRSLEGANDVWRYEVALPNATEEPIPTVGGLAENRGAVSTILVVEPEGEDRRTLVQRLGQLGQRAVPAHDAEEASQLLANLRFNAIICSLRLPGKSWASLLDQVPESTMFVLLSEGFDAGLAAIVRERGGSLAIRPLEDAQLEHLVRAIADRRAK